MYAKPFPTTKDLVWLSKLADEFPVTRRELVRVARDWGFSRRTLDFLRLFPENEVFESRADFVNRCEDLELLIKQEYEAPEEHLRSPQE